MILENESPALAATDPGPGKSTPLRAADDTPRPKKWKRILRAFVDGASLHRFQAEGLGDHVLHSTISKLEQKGLAFARRSEEVSGYAGCVTRVTRYALVPESRERALELLGRSR